MSRGYPDYFGVPIYPEYGSNILQERLVDTIALGERKVIFSLDHKALIRGGMLSIAGFEGEDTCILELTIDGQQLIPNLSLIGFRFVDLQQMVYPIYCTYYDTIGKRMMIGFIRDIPVGYQYELLLECGAAGGFTLEGNLWYTLIT